MNVRHTITLAACISLVASGLGCDVPTGPEDEDLGEEVGDEELGEAQAASCFGFSTPGTPDATGSIVGSPSSASASGYGSAPCDFYSLRVSASPSTGDKVGSAKISASTAGACLNPSGEAKVWTRQLGTWSVSNVPVSFDVEYRTVGGVQVPYCVAEGSVFYGISGSSTITDIQIGGAIATGSSDLEVHLEVRQPGIIFP